MANPTGAPVVKHTGGLRKLRFAKSTDGRGKSSSYRVCYVYFEEYATALLVTIFGKSEKSNLTRMECNLIASVIKEIERDLARGRV